MIGNLMSRMADADKLSVAQLNTAVKNGTLPAYIGVPLIQEKMKAQQAAQAMVAQDQMQPPIAQQVMEQADVATGLEKLQSNLPEEGYAGGGIVAFAEGGEAAPASTRAINVPPPEGYKFDAQTGQYHEAPQQDGILGNLRGLSDRLRAAIKGYAEGGLAPDDSGDAADEDKALFSRLMEGISNLKSYEGALAEKGHTPASIRELMRSGPKRGDYVAPAEGGRGHKFEGAVLEEAKRQGVDPDLALHVLYKETGGLKNPESARSRAGAIGPMQLMPATARDLGVDPTNPMENIQGGIAYLKQMMNKYQDPVMATAAYNAGPGRVDQAIRSGRGIAALPRETQMYVPRMAGGGMVAFADGGDVDNPYAMMGDVGASGPAYDQPTDINFGIGDFLKRKLMGIQEAPKPAAKPAAKPTSAAPAAPAAAPAEQTKPAVNPMGDLTGIEGDKGIGTLDDIKSMIKTGIEEGAKQKRVDTMLSLLTAGLGMMGGTSPFAAVNIGQGGQQGVAAALAARKTQAAEQQGLLGAQLGLSRAELYEKMRRDALSQKAKDTAFSQGLQQQRLDVTKSLIPIKGQELALKVNKAWEESSFKPQLEAQMAKEFGKNWNVPGSQAELMYKSRKANWLRDNAGIGTSNIPTADSILSNLNQ